MTTMSFEESERYFFAKFERMNRVQEWWIKTETGYQCSECKKETLFSDFRNNDFYSYHTDKCPRNKYIMSLHWLKK
jgi:hypothetical protein